jgi:predicted DNA-binding transcriptional regulator AlpA
MTSERTEVQDDADDDPGALVDWLTSEQVAELSGVDSVSIRRYVRRGTIPPPIRKGRTLLWKRSAIEAWVVERPRPGRPRKRTSPTRER